MSSFYCDHAVMRKNRHVTSKGIETDRRFTLDLTCQDKSNMQVINVCITSKRRIGGLNSSVGHFGNFLLHPHEIQSKPEWVENLMITLVFIPKQHQRKDMQHSVTIKKNILFK